MATKLEIAEMGRCQRCLGMGYKGAKVRGKWKILTCRRCGGTGTAPGYQR